MSLRAFLRRQPQPVRLRVRTDEDETRIIELSPDVRNRWKAAEEAVIGARAVLVECLDKSDSILRAQKLEVEGADDDAEDGGSSRDLSKAIMKERRDIAALVDAIGRNYNDAFDRGAKAANTGQENLVALVEMLTNQFASAMTNLHNVSVNLAHFIQASASETTEDGEGGNGKLMERVLALAATKAMGGAPDAHATNSKGKKQ
jgi:hypothetical protein